MTNLDQSAAALRCETPGCNWSAECTLTAAKTAGLREITRRCKPCAATTAWCRLAKGYAVIIEPLAGDQDDTEKIAVANPHAARVGSRR
jgi:hypothetical protein